MNSWFKQIFISLFNNNLMVFVCLLLFSGMFAVLQMFHMFILFNESSSFIYTSKCKNIVVFGDLHVLINILILTDPLPSSL